MDTSDNNIRDFIVEYLGKLESIGKKALAHGWTRGPDGVV
jgi:hypothetical protein